MNIENMNRLQSLIQGSTNLGLQFDMSLWFSDGFDGGSSCGTSACAFGHCVVDPHFVKQGIQLTTETHNEEGQYSIEYKGHTGYDAAEMVFDVTNEEAHFMFNPMVYTALYNIQDVPKQLVVDHIQFVIDSYTQQVKLAA